MDSIKFSSDDSLYLPLEEESMRKYEKQEEQERKYKEKMERDFFEKFIYKHDGYRPAGISLHKEPWHGAIHELWVKRDHKGYHYRIYTKLSNVALDKRVAYEQISYDLSQP